MSRNAATDGYAYSHVAKREDVEAAAWQGYQDAKQGRAISALYERQSDKWQRNYEIGRLWIAAMRAAGIKPPTWPVNTARPRDFTACLARMREAVGDVVPRGEPAAADPDLVMHAVVPDVRRGRLIERVTGRK